jgi:hypothetical protein
LQRARTERLRLGGIKSAKPGEELIRTRQTMVTADAELGDPPRLFLNRRQVLQRRLRRR